MSPTTGELTVSAAIAIGQPSTCFGLVLPLNSAEGALSLPDASTVVTRS